MIKCFIGFHNWEYSDQHINVNYLEFKHIDNPKLTYPTESVEFMNIIVKKKYTIKEIYGYPTMIFTTCRVCIHCMKKEYKDVNDIWVKTKENEQDIRNFKLNKLLND